MVIMGSNELYNLKWNDYHATLASAVGSLLDDSDFIDVTLACEGQSFSAHKVVLSACSSYFRRLLKRNPCKHPIVILRDVNANVLSSLIHFMYNGAVDVPQDLLPDFLSAAQSLQVRGLAESNAVTQVPPPREEKPSYSDYEAPSKRPRLSTPTPDRSQSRTLSYVMGGRASEKPQTSQSVSYIPVEKARSLISQPSERSSDPSDVVERLQSKRLSVFKMSSSSDGNNPEGSSSYFKEPIKQERSDEDIEIVTDDTEKVEQPDDPSQFEESGDNSYEEGEFTHPDSVLEDSSQGAFLDDGSGFATGDAENSRAYQQASSSTCPICFKTFSTTSNMKHHIKNIHENKPLDQWETCSVCGKKQKTRQLMLNHMAHRHRIYQKKKLYNWDPKGPSSAMGQ